MSATDAELIARTIIDNNRAAFGELVQRHQSAVRRFLRHLTRGDHAWADDLAQETFLQAYRSMSRFSGSSTFATWLLGIAHNLFRNARRRQRETASDSYADSVELSEAPTTSTSDLRHDLAGALAQLSTAEQTALHVCYQQGLSHHEAAQVLAWPVGTVKTHVARGKEKLRHLLASWNPTT